MKRNKGVDGNRPPSDPAGFDELDFRNADELVRKRQRFQRPAKKAANILSQLMAHRGIAQTQTSDELTETWKTIVGPVAKHTRLGNVRRGVLEVHVSNSMVSQQLSFEKHTILAELQARISNNKITDLRFRIGSVR